MSKAEDHWEHYANSKYMASCDSHGDAFLAGYAAAIKDAVEVAKESDGRHGWNYHAPTMAGEIASRIEKLTERGEG